MHRTLLCSDPFRSCQLPTAGSGEARVFLNFANNPGKLPSSTFPKNTTTQNGHIIRHLHNDEPELYRSKLGWRQNPNLKGKSKNNYGFVKNYFTLMLGRCCVIMVRAYASQMVNMNIMLLYSHRADFKNDINSLPSWRTVQKEQLGKTLHARLMFLDEALQGTPPLVGFKNLNSRSSH